MPSSPGLVGSEDLAHPHLLVRQMDTCRLDMHVPRELDQVDNVGRRRHTGARKIVLGVYESVRAAAV